ncbi:hypothetical protein CAAN3_05S07272 [[Candida] anglica]
MQCSICQTNPSKYTCPACEVKTCSLNCIRQHKKDANCTGTVDQTKFLAKKTLSSDDAHINRDYNFLLQVGRKIHVGKDDVKSNARNVFKRQFRNGSNNNNNGSNNKRQKPQTPSVDPRTFLVNKVFPNEPTTAVKRHNTLVVQLPPGMSRAASNKSGYDKKMGSFIWTIEWVYIDNSGEETTRFLSYRLKEGLLLREAVPLNILNKATSTSENGDKSVDIDRNELRFYLDNVLDKGKRKTSKSILKLRADVSISEALTDMVVLEFPTIYVTRNEETWKEFVSENQLEQDHSEDDSSSESESETDSSSDESSSEESESEDEGPEVESTKESDFVPQVVIDTNIINKEDSSKEVNGESAQVDVDGLEKETIVSVNEIEETSEMQNNEKVDEVEI